MKEQRFRGKFKGTGEFVDNLRLMENDGWYSLYNYLSDSIPEEDLAFDLMDRTFELTEIEDLEAYTVEVNKTVLEFRENPDIITPTIQGLYDVHIHLGSDDNKWNFKEKMNVLEVNPNVPMDLISYILENELDFVFKGERVVPEFTFKRKVEGPLTLEYEDSYNLDERLLFVDYNKETGLVSYYLYDKDKLVSYFLLN